MSTVYVVCVKTLVSIALQASPSGRRYPVGLRAAAGALCAVYAVAPLAALALVAKGFVAKVGRCNVKPVEIRVESAS